MDDNDTLKSTNRTKFVFRNEIWIVDLTIDSLLAIVSLYVMIFLIRHRIKRLKFQTQGRLTKESQLSSAAKRICIVIAVVAFVYQLLSLANLYLEKFVYRGNFSLQHERHVTEITCHVMPKVRVSVLIIATAMTYFFLWIRQRVFYVNPSLKALNSRVVKVTSYLVLTIWSLYFFPIVMAYLILVEYEHTTSSGCTIKQSSRILFRNIIVSWLSVSVAMQIALLALFINPILNRMTWRGQVTRKSKSFSRLMKRVR